MKKILKILLKKVENEFIKKIDNFLKNKDVVVISDYNKGVITKKLCQYIINGNLLNSNYYRSKK